MFSLEGEKEKRLEVSWSLSWNLSWKNIQIFVDGNQIGIIPDKKTFLLGQTFTLPNGSKLIIKLLQYPSYGLHVSLNGLPLPESDDNPVNRYKNIYITIYGFAIINLLYGIFSILFKVQFINWKEGNIAYIIICIIFLLLGYFVQRKSSTALLIAIYFLFIGSIVGFCLTSMGYINNLGWAAIQILFLINIIRDYNAMKMIKKSEK